MAIYHFSAQVMSRSKGQSAVASAAYRSGERLEDERTGEKKFYKREVQPETMILAPSHSPEWIQDRNRLWNEVEKSETRKNSQLAREINLALPRELSNNQQNELIKSYVQTEFVDKGMVADIAIHRDDQENPHAHVMLTTREISEEGFTVKNRDWNDRELLNQWREQWADHANKALEREGIQDRISHLSHEARGLEQLPTVHLGHVAHEMENRGVESDRGNLNRERQKYNRLVVDLQKYREEKQVIEQELARKQELFTDTERVELKEASKLLKAESTVQNIAERYEQLDKWEKRVTNNDQYLRWKDDKIREASEHQRWIQFSKNQIQQAQQRIDDINWLNPLKIKENRMTKERSLQDIAHANENIAFHDKKLGYHREKLKFNTEQEFHQVEKQHKTDYPGLLEKNRNQRGQIRHERDVLEKAVTAHKNAFVRQVASLYPERPEMAHMSLETAKKLAEINKLNGNQVVPLETIEKTLNNRKLEIQRLQGELSHVDRHQSRLQRAEGYLKNYEKHHAIVEKIENNPFLKGKMLVSTSAKQEYDHAISERDYYHDLMEKENVSGRTDFEKQTNIVEKMETRTPQYKEQIQSEVKGIGILEVVINGIEQASREMQREQKHQQQQTKSKSKRRSQSQWELDR